MKNYELTEPQLHIVKSLGIWLVITVLYLGLVFVGGAQDWGDASYNFNPDLLTHDQMNAAQFIGVVSGVYFSASVAIAYRSTKSAAVHWRLLFILLLTIISLYIINHFADAQINQIIHESIHPVRR